MLTPVADATHARQVDELDAIGLTLDAARGSATQKGFVCNTHVQHNVSVQTQSGVRKTTLLERSKASMELICPQRRYVVFNADPDSGKVYAVGKRITQ